MEEQTYTNREYKDSVFRMLYREKENLLQLYNALNRTSHNNPDELVVTTLENAIYLGMKNDVSFLLDARMTLYEHQSTWNPNMPLRDLFYIARLLEKHVNAGKRTIYSSALIRIPAPHFVVFYNGEKTLEEDMTLKLSDAFERPEETPALELKVRLININPGSNPELMSRCQTLREYSEFIERIRRNIRKQASVREAVERAVTECIREGILADFLRSQRSEVVAMSIFEYDHDEEMKKLEEDLRITLREEIMAEVQGEMREEIRAEVQDEMREEIRAEVEAKVRKEERKKARNEVLAEGQTRGREEGISEGETRFLLLVLNLRGPVPEWLRERILNEKDPGLLEGWMEAAANAGSVEDFLLKTGLGK